MHRGSSQEGFKLGYLACVTESRKHSVRCTSHNMPLFRCCTAKTQRRPGRCELKCTGLCPDACKGDDTVEISIRCPIKQVLPYNAFQELKHAESYCFFPPSLPPGVDFQSAINKRRATVDGDGETFESTPSVKTGLSLRLKGCSCRKTECCYILCLYICISAANVDALKLAGLLKSDVNSASLNGTHRLSTHRYRYCGPCPCVFRR